MDFSNEGMLEIYDVTSNLIREVVSFDHLVQNLLLLEVNDLRRNLQLEYLDLYLIHWPISVKPGEYVFPVNKEDLLPMDFRSVWADMEECQRLGLTKSIGVCNFSCQKIQNLLSHATIAPAINQVSNDSCDQHSFYKQYMYLKTDFIFIGRIEPSLATKEAEGLVLS